jgi:glutamyl-tRNA synthetase
MIITMKTREVPGSIERIVEMLRWSGIEWDEGPGAKKEGGGCGPYIQSHRLKIY